MRRATHLLLGIGLLVLGIVAYVLSTRNVGGNSTATLIVVLVICFAFILGVWISERRG